VYREIIARNPFDRVTFPKVGRPLIRTIEPEEFEQLLLACNPLGEIGPFADRAAARNRAILWILYDTGIRLSELCGLRTGDFDRKHALILAKGKGSKERRIALGNNCLRNLLYYLDRHRPGEEELADWGSAGEDHLFLAETRRPLTINGVTLLFARIRKRAGITDKRISPHIFRHSFAIRYLVLGNDPFSLQELLGHEDMTTVKNYMHMNDETINSKSASTAQGIICRRVCQGRKKHDDEAIGPRGRRSVRSERRGALVVFLSTESDPADAVFQSTYRQVLLRKMCGQQRLSLLAAGLQPIMRKPWGACKERASAATRCD
jgi:site-specific recombinase XerD